ncbi:enhancer of polycomb-like-domain-containing protein [Lanmaoa asiatica]|nr:enhancer of polycomb-like-domain-containing protein [Lanmaoa asiatica]
MFFLLSVNSSFFLNALHDMPRNHNLGTSALRNRNRVTNKTRLKVVHGNIDADALSFDEDEEKARIVSTAGVDAEDANEHHLQAVLSAASQRHQSVGRSTRGATEKITPVPAAYIPTPDSTGLVDNYVDLYHSNRWTQPDAYMRSSETVEEALSSGLIDSFTYYMDERDKEWLDRNNEEARGEGTSVQGAVSASGATTRSYPQRSAKAKGKEPESAQAVAITEDEFELVMGIFEKITHDKTEFLHHGLDGMTFPPFSDYQDIFAVPLPPSMFANFIVPTWIPPPAQLLRLAKAIYPYWRERRIERGGHRIIPVLNFDEADVINESYICFRRREIKSVRKTRASQATSSDKLLRLQSELAQSLELAKILVTREILKKENGQQVVQVWEKRLEFAELKRKFPALGNKEDEELLHEKERVAKKPRVESTNRITGLKIRTRESGDPGTPSLQTEAAIRPRERLSLINAAIERDITRRKERDHGYEDILENPYQRPSLPYTRRYWKVIPPFVRPSGSSLPDTEVEERGLEHLRYLRRRVTRSGNTMVDRRDAFSRRYGFSQAPHQSHRNIGRRLEEGLDENDEDTRRLRERWRFDDDDGPIVAPEGIDEQDRVLVDDFSPEYLRHMMTLLTEADQQHINNDATLVLVSTEGRQQSILPFRTGTQQPFVRRDTQTPRAFANGISQLATSRQMTSVPLSAVPNGVPIAMQTHMKALQPQSATPRISHAATLRPPGPPQMVNMIPAIPLSQTPPPHVTALSTVLVNGTVGGSPSPAPPPSDTDSVKLGSPPSGSATKGVTANGTDQHTPDAASSPATEPQQPVLPTGSPVRQKVEVQQPVSIPLNGYHIPINGYTIPNAAYMHSRPPNGLTAQQMQNLKMALQGQDVNAVMHGTQGRPIQTPYVGHLVPNGAHYNMQVTAGANLNLKLASGRQWNGVAPPLQQTPSLGNQQDVNTVPNTGSPNLTHATVGALPARTPSANGTRSVTRPGAIGSSVAHMMPGGQYASHSLSPHLQNAGSPPLPNSTSLPPHQSPPRQPLTPTMKMTSPSLQHQQAVPSSQGGY